LKRTALFGSFDELDIRVGRVVSAEEALTRRPTYRLTIDFGPEVGIKRSCGAY
jgi:tRNA-binding protein